MWSAIGALVGLLIGMVDDQLVPGLAIGLALVLMWRGHQLQHRLRWQCGAALLAVVLAKLFLVDLADAGSLSRIISFITVGGLTLLIGIKAPMPKGAVEPSINATTDEA